MRKCYGLQAYGMMGWRVGYIVHPLPAAGATQGLAAALDKVQDTIPICPSQARRRRPPRTCVADTSKVNVTRSCLEDVNVPYLLETI